MTNSADSPAGGGDDHGEESAGRSRPPHGEVGHEVEEARQPEIGGDDHHAEQQDECVRVDGSHSDVPRNDARGDHRRRPDDGHARTVDAEEREAPETEPHVRADEDGERDHPVQPVLVHDG